MLTNLNCNNTINKQFDFQMLLLPSANSQSPMGQSEPNLNQLKHLRDQFINQLICELDLNRELLDKKLGGLVSFDSDYSTLPNKFIDQSSEADSDDAVELSQEVMVPKQTPKISHNSSQRNDTKNIPKNYGKAILSFIKKWPHTKKLAASMGVSQSDLLTQVRRAKKKINSIEGLKRMWGFQHLDHKIKKCIRILSYEFLRKHSLAYIFHSKVKNYGTNIKYRRKLIEGVQNPTNFSNIKDY